MLFLAYSLFKSIIKFDKSVIFGIFPTLGHIGLYGGNLCMALSQFWYACMCIWLNHGLYVLILAYIRWYTPHISWICPIFMLFLIYICLKDLGRGRIGQNWGVYWPIFNGILLTYHEFALNLCYFWYIFALKT